MKEVDQNSEVGIEIIITIKGDSNNVKTQKEVFKEVQKTFFFLETVLDDPLFFSKGNVVEMIV